MSRWQIEWLVFSAYTVMCAVILIRYLWLTPYANLRFVVVGFWYICTMVGIFYLTFVYKKLKETK